MTRVKIETINGQVFEFEDFHEGPCRHRRLEPRETFSPDDLDVVQCVECGTKFTARQAKQLMEHNL